MKYQVMCSGKVVKFIQESLQLLFVLSLLSDLLLLLMKSQAFSKNWCILEGREFGGV